MRNAWLTLKHPLLTADVHEQILAAKRLGESVKCSLDLKRSISIIYPGDTTWACEGKHFNYPARCKARTVYHYVDGAFHAIARYSSSLIKLIPTPWGPPTFEIDGIKMLPTAALSPYDDAARKVALVKPSGKIVLDTCGGLGYFAAWCLEGGAHRVLSYEKNADVLWLRTLNPWSPAAGSSLDLIHADITQRIESIATASVDAVMHDPPRFGIAGELYSQWFYNQLARVVRRGGAVFHYTGSPNRLNSGRDLAREVDKRLKTAGIVTHRVGDSLIGRKVG